MSETQELKLACLHHAGGDLDKAKAHYEWVIGSAPEASEQRATDQLEQPFNYRHPSKHDGSMPRRCYLDQLTPEELMIRDVVATVEGLGAHPLLTTTVIKLMQAGEALADWIDIGLRDKAIAALLDPIPSPPSESSSQASPTDAAEDARPCTCHPLDRPEVCQHKYALNDCLQAAYHTISGTPEIPEGFTKWEGGEWTGDPNLSVDVLFESGTVNYGKRGVYETTAAFWHWPWDGRSDRIVAYRIIEAPAETGEVASELDSQVQAEGDRVALEDLPPISDSDFNALPKFDEDAAAQAYQDTLAKADKATDAEIDSAIKDLEQASIEQSQDKPHPDAEFWSKALTQPPTEREQAQSLISKLFGAPKAPKLEEV